MKTPRPVQNFEEEDAFSGWRKVMHWRPGEIKAIKRRYHRKERRWARRDIGDQREEK
jgi:hypothetical protein